MAGFPPLQEPLVEARRRADSGVGRVFRGDVRSADWDGGGDLSGGKDTSATQGYLIDYSSGSAQFQNIYADGGTIDNITIDAADITGSLSVGTYMGSGTSFPGSPSDGELFHRTDENRVYRYDADNTGWIAVDYLDDPDRVAAGTITAAKIAANTITAGQIAAGAIDTDELAANAVTAAKIAANTITASEIASETITAAEIDAGTLTVDKLVIGSFDNLIQNPGFEADYYSTADPHSYSEVGGGTWTINTSTIRSGARSAQHSATGQTGSDYIFLNGALTDQEAHAAAAEGDVFYVTGYARGSLSSPTVQPRLNIRFHDETGTIVGTTSTTAWAISGFTFQQCEVEATAPAGTAYVTAYVTVLTGGASGELLLFDDFYMRRKVGQLVIEDQAVDIDRMEDPVFADTVYSIDSSYTITTTAGQTMETTNLTVPSWVGTVNIMAVSNICVFSAGASQTCFHWTSIGGTDGPHVQDDLISGEDIVQTNTFTRSISSPGSTVAIALEGSVASSSESGCYVWVNAIAVGVR